MTSITYDPKKKGWRLQVFLEGYRRVLWLGPLSKSQAETVRQHIHALKLAHESGTTPEAHVRKWTQSVGERIATKLAEWGLIKPRQSTILKDYCKAFMDLEQHKSWAKSTRYNMQKVVDLLLARLGKKRLDQVTEADAEAFASYVYGLSKESDSHAGSQIKRARQIFNHAVKSRLIEVNPFLAVKVSNQIDEKRQAYISESAAMEILEQMPDQLWRVIFCLARFAGLRTPSEPLALTWSDIDWHTSTLRVLAPKQVRHKHKYLRTVPLSPLVLSELRKLFDTAPEGATHIVTRYRTQSTAHFRKPLINAIEKAGYKVWQKLYMNLRASCRTDWLKIAPKHAVNLWMGHSDKIGEAHYDRITADDWSRITNVLHHPQHHILQKPSEAQEKQAD